MTCKKLASLAIAATLLGALPATTLADEGLMIGAGAYYTLVDDELRGDRDFNDDVKALIDDSSYGLNASVGWRFNNWIAIEGGYFYLGEVESDKLESGGRVDIETDAWHAGAMLSVPLWIFDVYARGGVAMWDAEAKFGLADDGTDPYYGLGGALNLGGSIDLYAEWVRFDLNTDIDTFGLGLRFTF